MKKVFVAVAIILIASSCTKTPEDKAKGLIKNKLHETLHDEKSYESVSHGELDSVFTSYIEDDIYLTTRAKYEVYKEKFDKAMKDYDLYADMYSSTYRRKATNALGDAKEYLDSMKVYGPISDSIRTNFVPEFNGWSMNHSYRANNAAGNKVIGHFKFFFDKDLTKTINVKSISE